MWVGARPAPAPRASVVPPGHEGDAPAGLTKIELPTRVASIVGRFACDGEHDIPAVAALQQQLKLLPLNRALIPPEGVPEPSPDAVDAGAARAEPHLHASVSAPLRRRHLPAEVCEHRPAGRHMPQHGADPELGAGIAAGRKRSNRPHMRGRPQRQRLASAQPMRSTLTPISFGFATSTCPQPGNIADASAAPVASRRGRPRRALGQPRLRGGILGRCSRTRMATSGSVRTGTGCGLEQAPPVDASSDNPYPMPYGPTSLNEVLMGADAPTPRASLFRRDFLLNLFWLEPIPRTRIASLGKCLFQAHRIFRRSRHLARPHVMALGHPSQALVPARPRHVFCAATTLKLWQAVQK